MAWCKTGAASHSCTKYTGCRLRNANSKQHVGPAQHRPSSRRQQAGPPLECSAEAACGRAKSQLQTAMAIRSCGCSCGKDGAAEAPPGRNVPAGAAPTVSGGTPRFTCARPRSPRVSPAAAAYRWHPPAETAPPLAASQQKSVMPSRSLPLITRLESGHQGAPTTVAASTPAWPMSASMRPLSAASRPPLASSLDTALFLCAWSDCQRQHLVSTRDAPPPPRPSRATRREKNVFLRQNWGGVET